MNEKNMNELLERYFAGETSLEEERIIRAYLLAKGKEGDTSPEARLAAFFEEQKQFKLSEKQAALLKSRIATGNKPKSVLRVSIFRYSAGIAASLLLLASIWWSFNAQTEAEDDQSQQLVEATDWTRYEITDPEEAAAVLMNSVRMVSTGLKEGKAATSALSEIKKLTRPTE